MKDRQHALAAKIGEARKMISEVTEATNFAGAVDKLVSGYLSWYADTEKLLAAHFGEGDAATQFLESSAISFALSNAPEDTYRNYRVLIESQVRLLEQIASETR